MGLSLSSRHYYTQQSLSSPLGRMEARYYSSDGVCVHLCMAGDGGYLKRQGAGEDFALIALWEAHTLQL